MLFLTAEDYRSERGRGLVAAQGCDDDFIGHGSIRYYYGISNDRFSVGDMLQGGEDKEEQDIATRRNRIPRVIQEAILNGKFAGVPYAYDENLLVGEARGKFLTTLALENSLLPRTVSNRFWKLFADPKNRVEAWRE